jgi:hypothetical protein
MYKKVEDLAKKMKSATYFKCVLTLTISEVTGCSYTTILRYVWKKCIYVVNIMDKLNYIATDKAFKNTQKSEWHITVIEDF